MIFVVLQTALSAPLEFSYSGTIVSGELSNEPNHEQIDVTGQPFKLTFTLDDSLVFDGSGLPLEGALFPMRLDIPFLGGPLVAEVALDGLELNDGEFVDLISSEISIATDQVPSGQIDLFSEPLVPFGPISLTVFEAAIAVDFTFDDATTVSQELFLDPTSARVQVPPPPPGDGYTRRLNLTSRPSHGAQGDEDNKRIPVLDVKATSRVVRSRMHACLRPVAPSLASHAALFFQDSSGHDLLGLLPFSPSPPGEVCVDTTAGLGLPVPVDLQVELFEFSNDLVDQDDATYVGDSFLELELRTSLDDARVDLFDRANTVFGTSVIRATGVPKRLKADTLQRKLQAVVESLFANGCEQPVLESLVGSYDAGTGVVLGDSSLDGVVREGTLGAGTFSIDVSDSLSAGGANFSLVQAGQVVARRSDDGFVAGISSRVKGKRGVFLTLQGTCDPGPLPEALEEFASGNLSSW